MFPTPPLYSRFVYHPARRCGKTAALSGMNAVVVYVDEFEPGTFTRWCFQTHRDHSHFYRGGRYRKPPMARRLDPPAAGMVKVRDRTGKFTWQRATESSDTRRMLRNPIWGTF